MAYPLGSVVVLPGDTWHFHWAKSGEYVTQVTAIGPLSLEYKACDHCGSCHCRLQVKLQNPRRDAELSPQSQTYRCVALRVAAGQQGL